VANTTELKALPAEALYRRCDLAQFKFTTTAELADLAEFVGQDRALQAVQFGIGIRRQGFNLFLLGPAGSNLETEGRTKTRHARRAVSVQSQPLEANNHGCTQPRTVAKKWSSLLSEVLKTNIDPHRPYQSFFLKTEQFGRPVFPCTPRVPLQSRDRCSKQP
jgi:AAA domain